MTDPVVASNRSPLQKETFIPLPLGAVRPAGWLARQLAIQASGQSGHLDEFWESLDSRKTAWLGGPGECWERGPYYMDGLAPLAYLTGQQRLLDKVTRWCEYQLTTQRATGHIGPDQCTDWWPYAVVGKVLMQYAQASGDPRVVPALQRFCHYQLGLLDQRPLKEWAAFRAADQVLWVAWLYNRTGDEKLLALAGKLREQAYDWVDHFSHFRLTGKTHTAFPMETHVVNTAMGIKTPGLWWLLTGRPEDRQGAFDALANLAQYHGSAAGVFTGDEHLAGPAPTQGTELCAVVEEMFSLETLLSLFGQPGHGDLLERIAYNALPATFSPDMWTHQYDQQANQVLCTVAPRQWTNNSATANLFGLEPHFGCCTANQHQGWPKFVAHLWMATHDGGLAAVAYGPCEVSARVADGVGVALAVQTLYPFEDTITITVAPDRPAAFPLLLRIPAWARQARVTVNGRAEPGVQAGTFLRVQRQWTAGDRVTLTLPMTLRTERRHRGALTILRGPLVYSLAIGEKWNLLNGAGPAGDFEVLPTTPWNYGLLVDESDPASSIRVEATGKVGQLPFAPEFAPVRLTAPGRRLPQWSLQDDQAAPIPQGAIKSAEPLEELTLIPYGCAKLRITEFPTLVE